jgi:hypothetical protein
VRRDHDKNEKGFRSMTVVAIPKEGWCYAPYKKPKKGAATVRDPDTRPLFEVCDIADRNGQRAIAALQVYSFRREGKSDKGPRNDGQTAELRVGMTIRFKVQTFMYEKKGGRDDSRDDVFPADLEVIPEFSLVEVMVLPGTSESADKNFGLSIARIRPLQHSLYSYLTPTGLPLMPSSFDASMDLAKQLTERGESIQAMIETQCVSFFAAVDRRAHLTPVGPLMFRLSAVDSPAVESVHEIDVREEDLLRFTNAGDNIGYAIFLCDMAASAGALSVFVVRDPYFQKGDASFGEYRGLPLINTEKLLGFIDCKAVPGSDDDVQFDLPFDMESLEDPFAVVSTAPVLTAGGPPTCPDLVLHSEEVQSSRAYPITIGDSQQVPRPVCLLACLARLTLPSLCAGGHHEDLLLHPGDHGRQAQGPGRAHRLPQPEIAQERGLNHKMYGLFRAAIKLAPGRGQPRRRPRMNGAAGGAGPA